MHVLCRDTLDDHRLEADFTRNAQGRPLRVLQFGGGPFLRGFADWMIDVANGAGVLNARVSVVEAPLRGLDEILRQQDGLYSVLSRGIREGRPYSSLRLVSCVDQALAPSPDWFDLLRLAEEPELKIVISDVSEGYCSDADEFWHRRQSPRSFPAQIAALLYARFQALGGGPDSGLLFLPCETIESNGSNLARVVLQQASDWGLPEDFIAWIKACNHFCNTLVDCIVPKLSMVETEALRLDLGYADPLLVLAEPFRQWVIEGGAELARLFPLHEAGLDVIWVRDIKPHRVRKLRLFNGIHTIGGLVAFGSGLGIVADLVQDEALSDFLRKVLLDELVPFIPLPEAESRDYALQVLERMGNPDVRHEIDAILPYSVSKWQIRVLPAIRHHALVRGGTPLGLSFSLAALLDHYRGGFDETGGFIGRGAFAPYVVRDKPEVLAIFSESWRRFEDQETSREECLQTLLADPRLWGEDLNLIPGLSEQVGTAFDLIQAFGTRTALGIWMRNRGLASMNREPSISEMRYG